MTIPALRPDLQAIAQLIPPASSVLDLGCGEGDLLLYLARQKGVKVRGIELAENNVLACVRRGLTVRQGRLEEGLADYPDAHFDYVILSQTLPFLNDPGAVLEEMLRVGRRAIVSFPNWGYWRCRLDLLLTGCIPQAPDLPQRWSDPPRWQALTITDFARFTRERGIRITRQIYLDRDRVIRIRKFKNLLATTAIFQLEKASEPFTRHDAAPVT